MVARKNSAENFHRLKLVRSIFTSGEARYGLFTDTGVYKLGYRKPNTMLRDIALIFVLIVDAIGNSKEGTLQQVVESFVERKSSKGLI